LNKNRAQKSYRIWLINIIQSQLRQNLQNNSQLHIPKAWYRHRVIRLMSANLPRFRVYIIPKVLWGWMWLVGTTKTKSLPNEFWVFIFLKLFIIASYVSSVLIRKNLLNLGGLTYITQKILNDNSIDASHTMHRLSLRI